MFANPVPSLFQPFWNDYRQSLVDPESADLRYYETCSFGHTEDNAQKTAQLVLDGEKTATSSLLCDFEISGRPIPDPGALTIVVDGRGKAACIIETTHVAVVPFQDVDAQFAHDYGEGDRNLEFWHENMWQYYAEECTRLGVAARRDMLLVCEYFRVVHRGEARVTH